MVTEATLLRIVDAVERLAQGVDDLATYRHRDVREARRALAEIRHELEVRRARAADGRAEERVS
jgi:hypothetical protein